MYIAQMYNRMSPSFLYFYKKAMSLLQINSSAFGVVIGKDFSAGNGNDVRGHCGHRVDDISNK